MTKRELFEHYMTEAELALNKARNLVLEVGNINYDYGRGAAASSLSIALSNVTVTKTMAAMDFEKEMSDANVR